jgi:hypothetical protein
MGVRPDDAVQDRLIITLAGEPVITVNDLEVAHFVYLMLDKANLRSTIDTIRDHLRKVFISPFDPNLRPTISLVALVQGDLVYSANPGGWPLIEQKLDGRLPVRDDSDLPRWRREAMARVARDGLGQPLTTRLRAGDGEWSNVLMAPDKSRYWRLISQRSPGSFPKINRAQSC